MSGRLERHKTGPDKDARLVSSLLSSGSLVFDTGANIGAFSEVYAQAECNVMAVELNPASVQRLRLTTHGLSVQVLQAAVGAECGLATLYVSDKMEATSPLSETSPGWNAGMRDSSKK